jgi:tripartite-type tricarboxylate transporter receptor subunit TctC
LTANTNFEILGAAHAKPGVPLILTLPDSAKYIRSAICVFLASAACTTFGAQMPAPDSAQTFPARPIRLIVAFPPGGGNDIIARFVGVRLSTRLGQQIVNDNRGGASGIIGSEIVARSAPDGHTLLFTSVSHTMNEAIRKLPYDTLGSFSPVALFGRGPNVLVANPGLPAKTLAELIALAKASPGKINYASTGIAGMHHFGGELFKRLAGIDLAHVAYKGGGPAALAVVGGEVELMFSTLPLALPNIRAGRLRPLGVGGATRSALLPAVPTLSEAGARGYEFTVWWGVVAPALTPPPIINRLNAEINAILLDPEAAKQLAAEGADVTAWTPTQFGELLAENLNKWKRVAREADIRAE